MKLPFSKTRHPKLRPLTALDARGGTKPRLLFVDHIFHLKTRSFDFLVKVLRDAFDVHVIHVDPNAPVNQAALADDAEYVVIAQLDFLTPLFLAMGKRVTVVQMYDGSGFLPDSHYHLNKQARHLNFSATLHARALSLGVESHLVRYFHDPQDVPMVQDFSTLRGFFWQRLPHSGINAMMVRKMLGSQLDSLHIHTATDDDSTFDPNTVEGFECDVTTSDWFEQQADFIKLMEGCNVFIAPRYAEGIGHVFLEAMARGMVVVAYDQPTHNEYITHGLNGLLFSDTGKEIQIKDRDDLAQIGATARTGMTYGHTAWQQSCASIVAFISEAPVAQVPDLPDMKAILPNIVASYQQGIAAYVSTLAAYPELLGMFGNWDRLQAELGQDVTSQAGSDKSNRADFFFGYDGAHSILGQGWSASEPSHTWAVSRTAELIVPLERNADVATLDLEARGLGRYPLKVSLDGVPLGEIALQERFTRHRFDIPRASQERAKTGYIRIVLQVHDDTPIPQVEARSLCFSVKSMSLTLSDPASGAA